MARAMDGLVGWWGRGLDLLIHYQLIITGTAVALGQFLAGAFGVQAPWGLGLYALLVWQMYALDRFVVHPEDQALVSEDLHQLRFVRRHHAQFFWLLMGSVLLEIGTIVWHPQLWVGLVVGVLFGVGYIVDVPGLRRRLKTIPFLKSFYLALAYVATLLCCLRHWPVSAYECALVCGLYLYCVVNVLVFDIKDIANDRRAGIVTFANYFGRVPLLFGIQLVCLVLAIGFLRTAHAAFPALGVLFAGFGIAVGKLYTPTSGRYYFGLLDLLGVLPLVWTTTV